MYSPTRKELLPIPQILTLQSTFVRSLLELLEYSRETLHTNHPEFFI